MKAIIAGIFALILTACGAVNPLPGSENGSEPRGEENGSSESRDGGSDRGHDK